MKYRFATERESYEDLSSGRVLYGRPGATAFPVRIGSELFQRCAERLLRRGAAPPCSLYDPCCGGGYLVTVLGLLHAGRLRRIVASDIDAEAVERARLNLSLLTAAGMERRLAELRAMAAEYGKASHRDAIESGLRLKAGLTAQHESIQTLCFARDITSAEPLPAEVGPVDMVIADLPYGRTAAWKGAAGGQDAPRALLEQVRPVLAAHAVVALVSNKEQVVAHPAYRRAEVWSIGRRRVVLLEPEIRSAGE